ncbi:MAG: DinB family protein [Dehalococcoidia bacterium]
MTTRTFAPWVEPIAAAFQRQRAELAELVRSIPLEAWDRPSPNEGWTYRDLLGHVATRDPRSMRLVLEAVVTKNPLDPAQLLSEEESPINNQLLAEVRDFAIEQMVAYIDADTSGLLDLLAKLGSDDKDLRQAEFPISLSEALGMMPQHDRMHMEQLRTSLEAKA